MEPKPGIPFERSVRCPLQTTVRTERSCPASLDEREIQAVINALPVPLGTIAKLSALALMRLSEIILLRRKQADLPAGILTLPASPMTGGETVVVLGHLAQDLLATQVQLHGSEWVFPSPTGMPFSRQAGSYHLRKAAQVAGIPHFSFHELRRSAIQRALDRGIPAHILAQLARYKTPAISWPSHAVVTEADLRNAANIVAEGQ
jgi:integrase